MASRLSKRSLGYVYRMNVFGRGSVSDCSWRWYSWTTFGIVLKDPRLRGRYPSVTAKR